MNRMMAATISAGATTPRRTARIIAETGVDHAAADRDEHQEEVPNSSENSRCPADLLSQKSSAPDTDFGCPIDRSATSACRTASRPIGLRWRAKLIRVGR